MTIEAYTTAKTDELIGAAVADKVTAAAVPALVINDDAPDATDSTLSASAQRAAFGADAVTNTGTPLRQALNGAFAPGSAPAGITGATLGYDRRFQLYGWKPSHFRATRAALAKAAAGTAVCKLAHIGDSIQAGYLSGSYSLNSWPVQLRGLFGTAGIPSGGTGPVLPSLGQTGLTDGRWAFTGTWTLFSSSNTGAGSVRASIYLQATGTATATFTSDQTGTAVDVWYSNLSAPFTVAIDGGAPVTVTPDKADSSVKTYTVTGLSNATHTVVVSTTGTTYLGPAQVRAASGVLTANLGIIGGTSTQLYAANVPWGQTNFAAAWAPALVTVAMGTNEIGSTDATIFGNNVTGIVNSVRAAGADVLLIAEIPANGGDAALLAQKQKLFDLAASMDFPVLDLTDRWGTWAGANALGLYADDKHPSHSGQRDYAQAVYDAIRAA